MATQTYITNPNLDSQISSKNARLSSFFTDPALRRFFERGERDNGAAFAVPAPKPLPVDGGAVRELEHA